MRSSTLEPHPVCFSSIICSDGRKWGVPLVAFAGEVASIRIQRRQDVVILRFIFSIAVRVSKRRWLLHLHMGENPWRVNRKST